jgi:hypothetical protein
MSMSRIVDLRLLRTTLKLLRGALPTRTKILLLGNSAALIIGVPALTRTKDVDVSLILLRDKADVAPLPVVRKFVATLGGTITTEPEDGAWIRVSLPVGDGEITLEIIRGKSRDRPRGKFIARNILRAIAENAESRDGELIPALTDLIVMKAWAVTDQNRGLREEPHRGGHALRRDAYRDDARRLTELALDRGDLDLGRIQALLVLMKEHRRKEVKVVLEEIGALDPSNPSGPN